ncbi:DMT family transporter [Chlamydia sp. 17-3921]|uniref:DMT family transporter n=1 Tax=Chlamydia sp. 17-3921 TaxID=2675798 RepID=UPI00191B8CB0|nr:DMT family transporter [Chlamydia sp. 17-3921]
MSLFLVFFTAFIWSSSFAISKLVMSSAAPLFTTGIRMLFAGGVLASIVWMRRGSLRFPKQIFIHIIILAITGYYLANVCEFLGLQGLSSAKACFIYGLSPFISALFSYLQLKERISFKKIFGLGLGLIGYISYLVLGGESGGGQAWSWNFGLPEFLLLCATCFAAFGWTLLRKIEKNSSLSTSAINALAMLVAGGFSLVHSLCVEPWNPIPVQNIPLFLESVFTLVFISNLICYNLYAKLLRKYSSTFLSFCNLIMPLFAAFYGWILLRESFSWGLLPAVGFMILGCRLIYQEELRQGYIAS